MKRKITALRPLSAGRLLELHRETLALPCDAAERGLWGNALVLAECCFCGKRRAFADGQALLDALTVAEMELLLQALREDGSLPETRSNPQFDDARFARLKEGEGLGLH